MEFEWGAAKELANIKKHGVPFSDAVETFFDPRGSSLWTASIPGLKAVFTGLEKPWQGACSQLGLPAEGR